MIPRGSAETRGLDTGSAGVKSAPKACVVTAEAGKHQQGGHTQSWRNGQESHQEGTGPGLCGSTGWSIIGLEHHPYTKPKGVGLDIDSQLGHVRGGNRMMFLTLPLQEQQQKKGTGANLEFYPEGNEKVLKDLKLG